MPRKYTRKARHHRNKTRRMHRKSRGGARETIFATSLNGVRKEVKNGIPYMRSLGILTAGTEENKYGPKDKLVEAVDFEKGKGPEVLEKLIEKYNVTNQKLKKNFSYPLKENQKGKYFFMY